MTELLNVPKEELLQKLKEIKAMGWVDTGRTKNDGAVGNTLEDLLHIPENNLSIANTVDWELKAQRKKTGSLVTLFHLDPEPRKPVGAIQHLIPNYGWPHKTIENEMSFRATLTGNVYIDRGFKVTVNSVKRQVRLIFDASRTDRRHEAWLKDVERKVGLGEINPTPYWDFDTIQKKCAGKIRNTIFILADSRMKGSQEQFKYEDILLLEDFAFNNLLRGIINGHVFVDFDARTGHNHGTKFRIHSSDWPILYNKMTKVE